MKKWCLLFFLIVFLSDLQAQKDVVAEKLAPISGLFVVDLLAPINNISELHLGYEVALNRKKRASVLFDGFVGLAKKNLFDDVQTLGFDQRYTKFDRSKRNFGLGIHLRKYGFDAPYSWYIGPFINFRRYHFSVTEGYREGDFSSTAEVVHRSLTVVSERTNFGIELGFNSELSPNIFFNANLQLGGQRVLNKRSIPYDFPVDNFGFFVPPRNEIRDLIIDPGSNPDFPNAGLFNFSVGIAFAIR